MNKSFDDFRPTHIVYKNLKTALATYRGILTAGGWEPVPTGATLKIGMTDDRVPVLRKRLSISGDLGNASTDATFFDEQVEKAVKHF